MHLSRQAGWSWLVMVVLVLVLCIHQTPARRRRQHRHQDQEEQEEEEEWDMQQEQEDQEQHLRQKQRRERLELQQDEYKQKIRHKLLIIVLDGFRWDYIDRYEERTGDTLEGFRQFMDEGVRAEYLESVFPAESFPAWQTLQTGLYPENHDIVGNQFYDPEIHRQIAHSGQAFFNIEDQRSTQHMKWWQKDEPLWATAKKHNVSFSAYLWGRCDIPFDAEKRLRFDYCENLYQKDLTKTLRINVDKALINFQSGIDAAIIYEDSLEKVGEEYGPLSLQTEEKLKELDRGVKHLAERLNVTNMADIVNVIILSDHGMTYASPPMKRHHPKDFNVDEVEIRKVQLSDSLSKDSVRWVVGSGSHAAVYPKGKEYRQEVIDQLNRIEGVEVYERHDIPDRFHYKRSKNSPPILVLAKPGTVILSSASEVQRPAYHGMVPGNGYNPQRLIEQTKMGAAGYDPEEPDMRGILLAKGPDFRSGGEVLPPVKLVDVYELLCKVLGIPARPNDGVFERVKGFLRGGAGELAGSARLLLLVLPVSLCFMNSW